MNALSRRLALAAGALLALAAFTIPTAAAAAPATAGSAVLRGAHFSPDTPGVDVYLTALAGGTSTLWLSSVGYGDVSPYGRIAPGVYAVSMRPHGAPASAPAALTWTLDAQPGQAYTAAAVGMNSQLKGIVLRDELTPPAAGHGLVRVIQAASRAPHADIMVNNGTAVATDAAFATSTPYSTVSAGSWTLTAAATGDPAVRASTAVTIGSGSVSSVVVLDAKGAGLTLRTVVDAAGSAVTPIGSVPAGAGGTAATGHSWWRTDAPLVGIVVAGCLALTAIGRRRRTAA